jgi:hypothetical protein
MLPWIVAAFAAAVALGSIALVRRLRRRLDVLTQSYWELRYELTTLRERVARLDPEQPKDAGREAPSSTSVAFVPLTSLRPAPRPRT